MLKMNWMMIQQSISSIVCISTQPGLFLHTFICFPAELLQALTLCDVKFKTNCFKLSKYRSWYVQV